VSDEASEGGGQGARAATPLGGVRIAAAALLLAGSVLLSRVMGFVREAALANRVGAGPETDAYYAAFQLPDMLNYLLAGGALAVAFTPLYLRTREREGERAADELFQTVMGTLGGVVLVLTVGIWIGAEHLIDLQFPAFDAGTRALTTRLTRIVLPAQIFFVVGGIVRAVLMAHGRFGAQAAAPLVYNAAIIAGGLATGTVEGFAWGALAGAVIGMWLIPLADMRHVASVRMRIAPFDRRFLAFLWLALPLMLGLSLTTVDEWYERWFGGRLETGTVAILSFARRLMMAPVAIIGQAVAAAALPTLAALHAAGRSEDLDRTLLRTLQATVGLSIFAAVAVFTLAEPFVGVMYRHGSFGAEAAQRVSSVLAILAFAVPGWVGQQVAVRGFFARSEMWRPMGLGTGLALAAIPLYVALGDRYGAEGLAAAGALAISANALASLVWLRLRHGGPPLVPLAASCLRSWVLAVPAGLAAAAVVTGRPGYLGSVTDLALGGLVFAGVGAVGIGWLGDEVSRSQLQGIARRLRARLPRRP